jgi:hypothetical protein
VLVDGALVGRRVALERARGLITMGPMSLRYRAAGSGLLTLQIADDDAVWLRHNTRLNPGASFKLHRGVVRVRRQAADGTDQTALLRR